MGYVDPQTIHNPATNTIAPAAWGDGVNAAIKWGLDEACRMRLRNTAVQSLTNNTSTAITFDTELRDVGGMHSTSSNTSRGTVPAGAGGDYIATAAVEFASNATGYREVLIRKNGTTVVGGQRLPAVSGATTIVEVVTDVLTLVAGDYLEVMALQTSGGALNSTATSPAYPAFTMKWEAT